MKRFPTKTVMASLREIGWSSWDPIGLADVRTTCESEYDSYLLVAYGMSARGLAISEVAHYLEKIETEQLGRNSIHGGSSSAHATAEKIMNLAVEFQKNRTP